MGTLIKGTVVLDAGRTETFVAGPRERIITARELGIRLTEEAFTEEVLVHIAFVSLRLAGKVPTDSTFDAFLMQLADYEVDQDPESTAPPA